MSTKQVCSRIPLLFTILLILTVPRKAKKISKRYPRSWSWLTKKTKYRKIARTTSSGVYITHTDPTNRYKIGDTFFSLPVPEVQELLSGSVEKIDGEITVLEEKMGELGEEMSELKAALYGRFGRSINLET